MDSQTLLTFLEEIELGGATVLEHGDFTFNAASDGVIGGLYGGAVSIAGCLAGFRITAAGANCNIQALVGGAMIGATLATQPGHHYVFTTQLYPAEVYRTQQVFHSSSHASGAARGGGAVAGDVRVVLEVHDIDSDESDAADCSVDRALRRRDYKRSWLLRLCADQCGEYQLLGRIHLSLAGSGCAGAKHTVRGNDVHGADRTVAGWRQCSVTTTPALQFYPEYIPPANAAIEVSYRGQRHAMARVIDSASIAAHQRDGDDGVRASVREVALPVPRTSADCETAALALLDDAGQGWTGEYQAWNKFLPGAARNFSR